MYPLNLRFPRRDELCVRDGGVLSTDPMPIDMTAALMQLIMYVLLTGLIGGMGVSVAAVVELNAGVTVTG